MRKVVVDRVMSQSLGVSLVGVEAIKGQVYVSLIEHASPCAAMLVGDRILSINGATASDLSLGNITHPSLHSAGDRVVLCRRDH